MPSHSLIRWNGERADALDEIENAHAKVGGTERGRRYATQQINYSYAALLSGHFQGFCRDLHSECVDHIVAIIPAPLRGFLREELIRNRLLSRGNPHPGTIGADFNRLGVDFWTEVYALNARNERRRELLQELVDWRNAIAHQDFDPVAPGGVPTLHLATVRGWRNAVNSLARSFDQRMYNYLQALLGGAPW
jgi:RiboL-PSP-HEPN